MTPPVAQRHARHRDGRWATARRWATLTVAAVVTLAGATSIAGQLWTWMDRTPPASPTAGPTDAELAGLAAAIAVDYLSWDDRARPARQAALSWAAAPDRELDGWDGTGRQHADSPAVLGITRLGTDTAIVTVRTRVTPLAPPGSGQPATTHPTVRPTSTTSIAAAPLPPSEPPGAGPATPGSEVPRGRWLTLAVPLRRIGTRLLFTAPPALVGSPTDTTDTSGPDRAGTSTRSSTGGAGAVQAPAAQTRDTVARLLAAYAADDLDFVRAPHTTFTGLGGAVTVDRLTDWQLINGTATGASGVDTDAAVLIGRATVVWVLPDSAARLRCSYQLRLHRHNDRWLLAAVLPALEVTS